MYHPMELLRSFLEIGLGNQECLLVRGFNIPPLPRIADLLDKLEKYRYFTSIDLASGYYSVRIAVYNTQKTTFIAN